MTEPVDTFTNPKGSVAKARAYDRVNEFVYAVMPDANPETNSLLVRVRGLYLQRQHQKEYVTHLAETARRLTESLRHWKRAALKVSYEIETAVAEALEYPYDDEYGYATGDHVEVTLVMELISKYKLLQQLDRPLTDVQRASIVDTKEIAHRLGYTPGAVTHWIRTYKDFPKPINGSRIKVFWWPDVWAWYQNHESAIEQRVLRQHGDTLGD